MFINEWLKKMWYVIFTMEYISAVKKNKKRILPFALWMDIESIMQNEISQTKTGTVWSHLYVESEKTKLIEGEIRFVVIRGCVHVEENCKKVVKRHKLS